MAISEKISEVQASLQDIKRKSKFKKARLAREEAVELAATLAKCRGKLEICKKDLSRAINTQSRNITAGIEVGADTLIQEQILWDSAIGYMLVKDAIYALETVSSYDAVSHAYEMLEAAMKQVTGKKSNFPHMKVGSTKERNAYGYITSSAALKNKEALLESFFEDLKRYGGIEARLAEARIPGAKQAELRHACTEDSDVSEIDERMSRLNGTPAAAPQEDLHDEGMDALLDIHPPKYD